VHFAPQRCKLKLKVSYFRHYLIAEALHIVALERAQRQSCEPSLNPQITKLPYLVSGQRMADACELDRMGAASATFELSQPSEQVARFVHAARYPVPSV
jgi:hypothetical protein